MSRKISEYFHIKSNFEDNVNIEHAKVIQNHQMREENSQRIYNNFLNSSKTQECYVILKDIGINIHKISAPIQKNIFKTPQNIKNEQDQEYIIELPIHQNSTDIPIKIKETKMKSIALKSSNSGEFKCTKCFQKFKTHEILKNHKIHCTKSCEYCGRIFSEASNLRRHQRDIHTSQLKETIFSCNICDQKFFQKSSWILHKKLKHSDGQLIKYECDFDGKLFKSRSAIHIHIQRHLPSVKCKICNAELKIGSVLSHMKEIHLNLQKIICKICQKSFKALNRLKHHLKIHDKKFKCSICDRKFPNFPKLRDHLRNIHENPGSYSCEICAKKFNRAENLKNHLKFHEKNRPKPFKCQRCDFATHSNANYNYHLTSHERHDKKAATMKNPVNCKKCPAIFETRKKFELHMKLSHSLHLQVQCDLCGNYLKNKVYLSKHMKIHLKCRN